MSVKKLSVLLAVIVIASLVMTACAPAQPQVVEKVVTQVVEKEVVQTQVVETERIVEVVATPTPQPPVAVPVGAEGLRACPRPWLILHCC